MIRWFQFGAFSPLFRMHGDRAPRTPLGRDIKNTLVDNLGNEIAFCQTNQEDAEILSKRIGEKTLDFTAFAYVNDAASQAGVIRQGGLDRIGANITDMNPVAPFQKAQGDFPADAVCRAGNQHSFSCHCATSIPLF